MQETNKDKLFLQINHERKKLDFMVSEAIKNGLDMSGNFEIIKQSKLLDSLMNASLLEKDN